MKPLGQRWTTTLTCCQSKPHHVYKDQERGGLRPRWTDLPKGFVVTRQACAFASQKHKCSDCCILVTICGILSLHYIHV